MGKRLVGSKQERIANGVYFIFTVSIKPYSTGWGCTVEYEGAM